MSLYIPRSIFHLARLLYVRPETFGPTLVYIHIFVFESEFFPTTAVQQRQYVDAAGCGTFMSGLISFFVFDILQIPSRCIQIYSGCIARNFVQLATGLPLTSV